VSLRSSRRSKAAERASKDQADRATKAAEDAVAAQNKIAAEIRRLGDDSARQREDEERAPWRVDKLARDDYRLVNLRPTSKYHVRLRGAAVRPDGRNYFAEITGNGSVNIDLFIRPEQFPDPTVKVTWHPTRDHSGPAWEQPFQP
jgi:hypothetical protein